MSPTTRIRGVALFAVVAVALLGGAAGTAWARSHARTFHVQAPSANGVVIGGSVQVVVRVPTGIRSFRVLVRGRNVTRAFRRRPGGLRVATLRPGSTTGLRFGRNTAYVRVSRRRGKRDYRHVRFVLARRVNGLILGARARPSLAARGHAALRVRLARPGLQVSYRLNRERRATSILGHRLRRARLIDADAGLRQGRNFVRVRVFDLSRGEYAIRRLRVVMPRTSPIPGAGLDRRGRVGQLMTGDARRTVAARHGARLRFRWRIVRHPHGSHARLHRVTSRRPRLRADVPGHYVLRVKVTELHRRRESHRYTRLRGSSDTVEFAAAVDAPPIGVPIDTITKQPDAVGVSVGDQFFSSGGKRLQMVVLDRQTLEVAHNSDGTPMNNTYDNANDATGAQQLLADVKALKASQAAGPADGGYLVIITAPNASGTTGTPDDAKATIAQALGLIGADEASAAIPSDSFSAIGAPIPGWQGSVNLGLSAVSPQELAGTMIGYLQHSVPTMTTANLAPTFSYVDRERVAFDTGDPKDNPATVTVGGTPYTSAPVQAGFFVVVLDAGSLADTHMGGTFVDGPNPEPGTGNLGAMHTALSSVSTDPSKLVIVRSIGNVGSQVGTNQGGTEGTDWDNVAADLKRLGGSTYYFDALDPQQSPFYAQVGPGGQSGPTGSEPPSYPSDQTQVASTQRNGAGQLSGLLGRNAAGQMRPAESAAPGTPFDRTLTGVLSTPPSEWPYRSTAGDQAALTCIANELGLSMPIEFHYADDTTLPWATYKEDLDGYDPTQICPAVPASDYANVKKQLDTEFQDLTIVIPHLDALKQPFSSAVGTSDVESVASTINDDVDASSQPVQSNGASILSDALWIVGSLPIEDLAIPFNLASAGAALDSDLVDSTGANVVGNLATTGEDLGAKLADQYEQGKLGIGRAEAIIVSDWPKLQQAAANSVLKSTVPGSWAFNDTIGGNADYGLAASAKRQAYEAIFPAAYTLYRASQGTQPSNTWNGQEVTGYPCDLIVPTGKYSAKLVHFNPFTGNPHYNGTDVAVDGRGQVEHWLYATSDDRFLVNDDFHPKFPDETSVLQDMFAGPNPLFKPLQFAVEAYDDGASTKSAPVEHVTHEGANALGVGTNLSCTTTGP